MRTSFRIASLLCALCHSSRIRAELSAPLIQLTARLGLHTLVPKAMLSVTTPHGPIHCAAPDAATLPPYTDILVPELSRYPASLVKRTGLKRLVLCGALSLSGQTRNAVPNFAEQALYLDISLGSYNPTYLRKVFHHDFFHLIDYADDGALYSDPQWSALNPRNFRYGNGGNKAQDRAEGSLLNETLKGFLTEYSTTGIEEDKAEVFSNLMVEPETLRRKAMSDPVVRAKIEHLKASLRRFCPDLNDAYWQRGLAPGPGSNNIK